jgi:hypothetical protein
MLGELIGVRENIGRRRVENIEKETDVFLIEPPGRNDRAVRRQGRQKRGVFSAKTDTHCGDGTCCQAPDNGDNNRISLIHITPFNPNFSHL